MGKFTRAAISAVALSAMAAVPAVASSARHVRVGDSYFRPGRLTITRNTRVIWRWDAGSGIPHNVAVARGPAHFHSRTMSAGSFTYLFKKRGTYHLYCTIHPTHMRETIVVR